jgi:hypothetical protein
MSKKLPPPSSTSSSSTSTLNPSNQQVHIYINFLRPQDALACIQAVDGSLAIDGVTRLKASWGTTKYCANWLRTGRCTVEGCTGAHELGEEVGGTTEREREGREEMSMMWGPFLFVHTTISQSS